MKKYNTYLLREILFFITVSILIVGFTVTTGILTKINIDLFNFEREISNCNHTIHVTARENITGFHQDVFSNQTLVNLTS